MKPEGNLGWVCGARAAHQILPQGPSFLQIGNEGPIQPGMARKCRRYENTTPVGAAFVAALGPHRVLGAEGEGLVTPLTLVWLESVTLPLNPGRW